MITDLTEGKPSKVLWGFSIPMLLSVVFQQLYNIVDSVVAGKFIGALALAAVGASYPITMIFMAIATGANVGAAVIISQLFGAKNFEKLKTSIFTSVISIVVLAAALSVIGIIACGGMLGMLNTPDNIFADSKVYLNIYIGGLIFLFLYNICTGVFTALGDSRTPLYFLIASSVGNIILDIVFVVVFDMGVAGVAWATFIAQGISSLLAFTVMLKRISGIKSGKYKKFSFRMLGNISRVAVPSILQQSFVSVGNLFIQSRVNSFGSDVIAGYSAAIKLNTFAITSFGTLGNAMSSYTAQNTGAGKLSRIPQGLKAAVVMLIIVALPFFAAYFIFPNAMMKIFVNSGESGIIEVGKMFLRIASPFYFIAATKLTVDGILRGAGLMKEFMSATFADLLLRVILAYILSYMLGSEIGIWLSWPIGWTIASVLSCAFYAVFYKKRLKKASAPMRL
ncbi:MAG: MATE family efflux transporter [Oscillospiraceae bacterium]|nr:MATE family efflux transporter [Oscillospiraceae bacterium]